MKPIPLAAYLADPRPTATLWGPPEGESLHAQDIDEAIDDILADYPEDDPPETIEVAGFRRMTVPASEWSADLAAKYTWACEEVVRVVVDVAAWLAANPASDL